MHSNGRCQASIGKLLFPGGPDALSSLPASFVSDCSQGLNHVFFLSSLPSFWNNLDHKRDMIQTTQKHSYKHEDKIKLTFHYPVLIILNSLGYFLYHSVFSVYTHRHMTTSNQNLCLFVCLFTYLFRQFCCAAQASTSEPFCFTLLRAKMTAPYHHACPQFNFNFYYVAFFNLYFGIGSLCMVITGLIFAMLPRVALSLQLSPCFDIPSAHRMTGMYHGAWQFQFFKSDLSFFPPC